jgi:Uma2 family endonuclease
MSRLARSLKHTFEDYLALEEVSNTKHEYYEGEIYAMAGGTPDHAALSAAAITLLGQQLAGSPCRVFTSDLRIRVEKTGLATYPDVSVVCGEIVLDPASSTTVLNPKLLIEVLSDSTVEYDRGEKFIHYQKISSLEYCLFVSHRSVELEVWRRNEDQWSMSTYGPGQVADLQGLGCQLSVDQLYQGIG